MELNCLYLLKKQAPFYRVIKRFGVMDVYHKESKTHVARCTTQREVRNAVRAYSIDHTAHTTKGRE